MRQLVLVMLGACGRLGFDGPSGMTQDLIVSISDDRLAGPPTMASIAELPSGAVGLSLREALAIAENHLGPDRITFDTNALQPGATITIASELVVGDSNTTIDATNTAITISGAPGYARALLHVTGTGAVLDGLALHAGGIAIQAVGVSGLTIRHVTTYETSAVAIRIDGGSQVISRQDPTRAMRLLISGKTCCPISPLVFSAAAPILEQSRAINIAEYVRSA